MKYFYFLLFLALPGSLLAQSNYNPGYVIKSNGDTVKGYIDYREWEQTPRVINFKINVNNKNDVQFYPTTARGFQVIGQESDIFYEGDISMDKTEFPNLPAFLDTTKQHDVVFLRLLVTGKYLTLYYNGDAIKRRYFIAEANKQPVELIYHQYYGEGNTTVPSNIYVGQLLLYAEKYDQGNELLIKKVNKLSYEQEYLEAIVNQINGNKIDTKKIVKSRFTIGAGISNTQTQVYGGLNTATTISPKLSLGIDVFNNPYIQQLILRAEVSFSYVTPKINLPYSEVYTFDQYTASFTPQLLYNFYNKDKLKLYLDAGISFNLSTYSHNQESIEAGQVINKPYDLQGFYASFPLQAGAVFNKKIEVFLSYTSYTAYTQYEQFFASNQNFTLGVKYLFK